MSWNGIKYAVAQVAQGVGEVTSNAKQATIDVLSSPKVAGAAAAFTTGSGIGSSFDWIPDDIGKIATLFGLVLTTVLIIVHGFNLRKSMLEYEKAKLELAALKERRREEAKRKQAETTE